MTRGSSSSQPHNAQGRGARRGRGLNHRRMELIASVSRGSGVEKDGDALKDFKTQEEYRVFIEEKLTTFRDRYGRREQKSESEAETSQRLDSHENILILFRKLREGLLSAKRHDDFSVEVYETSLHLSILFDSPVQTTSILSHLIPDLYLEVPSPHGSVTASVLLSLLHSLRVEYPSQHSFHEHLKALPPALFDRQSEAYVWITSLAWTLRTNHYFRLADFTSPAAFSHFGIISRRRYSSHTAGQDDKRGRFAEEALHVLVDRLRTKARGQAWLVIRSAYRELSLSAPHRDWLTRSLSLQSIIPGAPDITLEDWLEERSQQGHVKQKEGVEGRWLICKVK